MRLLVIHCWGRWRIDLPTKKRRKLSQPPRRGSRAMRKEAMGKRQKKGAPQRRSWETLEASPGFLVSASHSFPATTWTSAPDGNSGSSGVWPSQFVRKRSTTFITGANRVFSWCPVSTPSSVWDPLASISWPTLSKWEKPKLQRMLEKVRNEFYPKQIRNNWVQKTRNNFEPKNIQAASFHEVMSLGHATTGVEGMRTW